MQTSIQTSVITWSMKGAPDSGYLHRNTPATGEACRENASKMLPTILLADDQQEMLDTAALILEDDFKIVGTAVTGMNAIELVMQLAPDAVVLDISMPGLSGIETATRLRDAGCGSRVIFFTIHDDADFVRAALSTGALGYVLKPALATDLVPAVWAALQGNIYISRSVHLQ